VQNGQAIFQTSPHLDILTVDAGARVAVLAGHGVLLVEQLVIAEGGELDLRDNDLVVQAGDFASLRALVFSGFRRAQGITSSASDGSMILALFDNLLVGALEWTGQSLAPTAIIGKYTYFGDLNLDGQVTGDDYTIIDANLNTMPPQGIEWLRGDANLDGFVTGDDHTVVDANLGLGSGNALAPVARPESNWLSRRDENDELLY
jgi:hypothetical protein